MPRKATRELKPVGSGFEPGPYKFKVINIEDAPKYDSWNVELQTWTEDGQDGPKVKHYIQHSNYKEEWHEDEPNRIFQTMCGTLEVDMRDLMGRTGYIVLAWDNRGYLSPCKKAGFFTPERKDAFGEETMSSSIDYAMSTEKVAKPAQQESKPKANSAPGL